MPIQNTPSVLAQFRRVEFTLDEFKRLLDDHGYDARWSKAMFCPNRDPDQPDHHTINCELCEANGYVYFDPRNIRVLATSYSTKQAFMPESRYEPGTAFFTARPEYKLSFWDKLELTSAKTRFAEVIKVTPSLTYKLKYPVISIERVMLNSGTVVPAGTVTVNPNGTITFPSTPPGKFFGISYYYHPTYVIIDMIHQVRDARITIVDEGKEADFPTQGAGRLSFLVYDESKQ